LSGLHSIEDNKGVKWKKPSLCLAVLACVVLIFDPLGVAAEAGELTGPPAAPADLSYIIAGETLTITWSESPGAEGYRVSIGDAPGQYTHGTFDLPASTSIGPVDIRLLDGRTYYLAVSAYSASGESEKSNEIAVKLPPPQAGPFSTEAIARLLLDDFPGRLSGIPLGVMIGLAPFIGVEPVIDFASLKRPDLYKKTPDGFLIDYGTEFHAKDGLVHSGSITISFSNYSHRWGLTDSGFSGVADNVFIDGRYLADGAFFGSFSAAYEGNTIIADIFFRGVFYSSAGPVYLRGEVSFDTAVCPDFPVSGRLEAEQEGGSETLVFTPACDGSFENERQ